MATIGSLVVRIGADVGDLERGLGGAQERLASFGREMQGLGTGMMLGLTAPLAGVGVAALRSAGEFEQAMAVTQQVLGATAAEMGAMEAAALAMGAESVFSAGEVAAGMQELAKAGMDAAGVMDAMPGVVALAAAAGTDLGTAAAYTAATLNAFGLEASEANRVADLLAATANASAADMTDLAQGLQQGGFAFAAAGQGVDDLAASLAVLTNVGLTGSDAGTALKNAMIRLMSPTKEAAALMEGLGIEVYDAAGNMLAFPDILGELNGGLAGMTQAQRNAALETIFLSDGMKAMIPLLDVGVDGYLRMREAVNEQGAASAVAAARMSGLTGAVEYLRGSVDSFLIGAAQPYLAFLAEGLRQAGDLVTAFGEMDAATRNGALAFAAVLAAAGPAIFAVGTLAGALAFLVTPLGLVVAASAVLAGAWAADFGGMRERTGEAVAAVVAFGERVAAVGQEVAAGVGTWATGVGERAMAVGMALAEGVAQGLAEAQAWLWERVGGFFEGMVERVREVLGVQSPSTVMMEIGADVVAGLVVGVERELAAAVAAATRVGGAVADGVRAGLEKGMAGMASGAAVVAEVEAALAVKWGELRVDGAALVARVGEALGALEWGGLRLDWGPLAARVGEAWRETMATVGASLEGFGELGPAQQFRRVMEVVTAGLTLYGDLKVAAIEAAGMTVAELATGLAELATAGLGQVDGQAVAAAVTGVVEGFARQLEAAFAPQSMEALGQAVGTLAGTIVTKVGEVLGSPGFGQDVGAAMLAAAGAVADGAYALATGFADALAATDWNTFGRQVAQFVGGLVDGILKGLVDAVRGTMADQEMAWIDRGLTPPTDAFGRTTSYFDAAFSDAMTELLFGLVGQNAPDWALILPNVAPLELSLENAGAAADLFAGSLLAGSSATWPSLENLTQAAEENATEMAEVAKAQATATAAADAFAGSLLEGASATWPSLESLEGATAAADAATARMENAPAWWESWEWPDWEWPSLPQWTWPSIPMPSWLGGWFDRASAVEAQRNIRLVRIIPQIIPPRPRRPPPAPAPAIAHLAKKPTVFPAGMAGAGMAELAGAGMGEAAIHVHLDGVVIRSDEDLAALAYRLGQYLKGRV